MTEAVHTEHHGLYTISIHYDDAPLNPWTEGGDTSPPVIARTSDWRRATITVYASHPDDLPGDDSVPVLTDAQVRQHWRALLTLLGYSQEPTWRDLRQFMNTEGNGWGVIDSLRDAVYEHDADDPLDYLADVYTLIGIPAFTFSAHGYSQRDYADLLVVYTPAYCRRMGIPTDHDFTAAAANARQLWEDWAYGNCYGYTITLGTTPVTSCYGYFGDYDHNALIAAREELTGYLRDAPALVALLEPGDEPPAERIILAYSDTPDNRAALRTLQAEHPGSVVTTTTATTVATTTAATKAL